MTSINEQLKELILRLKKCDMSAFDQFYELTKRLVYFNIYGFLGNKEDSEDILQETYVKFLNNIDSINEDASVFGYLLTTSKNLSFNFLKVAARTRQFGENEEVNISSSEDTKVDENELILKIETLLKPKEFQIVYLKVVEDYSHKEIAELLGKPLGTIIWAYNNAIKKLQKGLKNTYGQD